MSPEISARYLEKPSLSAACIDRHRRQWKLSSPSTTRTTSGTRRESEGLERMKRLLMFAATILILGGLYSLHVGAWSPHVESGAWAWIQPVSDQPPVSMVVERDGATAVLLPGGRVLIAGGANIAGEPTNNVELFDQSGALFAAMPMHVARAHHSATLLKSGLVLVAGGTTTGGVATETAEIYDPLADAWADAGSLPAPRSGHTATLLQDGQHILIAGGESDGAALASMLLYTEGLGFSAAGSMSAPRKNHAAALLHDGRVLLAGGSDGAQPLASSDVFDPADWTFGPGPSMSAPREGLTAKT